MELVNKVKNTNVWNTIKESAVWKKVDDTIHWKQRQQEKEQEAIRQQHEKAEALLRNYAQAKFLAEAITEQKKDFKYMVQIEIIDYDVFNGGREGDAFIKVLERAIIQLEVIRNAIEMRRTEQK